MSDKKYETMTVKERADAIIEFMFGHAHTECEEIWDLIARIKELEEQNTKLKEDKKELLRRTKLWNEELEIILGKLKEIN